MDVRSLVAAFVGVGRNRREGFSMRKLCKVMVIFTPLIIATIFHLYTYVVVIKLYTVNRHSLLYLSYTQQTFYFYFFIIIFFYCSGFCHTLKWNSHGFTCVPHSDPPSHLPLHPIPLGLPSAPGLSTWLMHPTWAGDLFHPR